MKKVVFRLFFVVALFLLVMVAVPKTYAAGEQLCSDAQVELTTNFPGGLGADREKFVFNQSYGPFDFVLNGVNANSTYFLRVKQDQNGPDTTIGETDDVNSQLVDGTGQASFIGRSDRRWFRQAGNSEETNLSPQYGSCLTYFIALVEGRSTRDNTEICRLGYYEVCEPQDSLSCGQFYVTQLNSQGEPTSQCFDEGSATVHIRGMKYSNGDEYEGDVEIQFPGTGIMGNDKEINLTNGNGTKTFNISSDDIGKELEIKAAVGGREICSKRITVSAACNDDQRGVVVTDDNPPPDESGNDETETALFGLCEQIPPGDDSSLQACRSCVSSSGIWTAVGCVNTAPKNMIATVVRIGLSLAGGVAMLMILAAGFTFSISQGDPKRTSSAKEMMTSAVVGLLFVIFSVTILQFIGVSVFQIPGFGG